MSPRRYSPEFQRERLLAAVCDVVAHEGYERLTVARAAEAAGVSTKTFYEFFADKREAFGAAVLEASEDLMGRVEEVCRRKLTFEAAVPAAIRCGGEFIAERPSEAVVCFVGLLEASDEALRYRNALVKRWARRLETGPWTDVDGALGGELTAEVALGGTLDVFAGRLAADGTIDVESTLPALAYWLFLARMRPAQARAAMERLEKSLAATRCSTTPRSQALR